MLKFFTKIAQSEVYQNPIIQTIIHIIVLAIGWYLSQNSAVETLTIGGLFRLISQWLESRPLKK